MTGIKRLLEQELDLVEKIREREKLVALVASSEKHRYETETRNEKARLRALQHKIEQITK